MLRQMRISMIFLSIGYLAVGLLLLIMPDISLMWICYAFGAVILVTGAIELIRYLRARGHGIAAPFMLISGVIAAAIGVFLLLRPDFVFTVLPAVFGLFILLDGLLRIENAFELAHAHGHGWWALLLMGAISVLLGLLLILRPLDSIINIVMLCGLLLVIEGALNLGCIIYASTELRAATRAVRSAAEAAQRAEEAALRAEEAAQTAIDVPAEDIHPVAETAEATEPAAEPAPAIESAAAPEAEDAPLPEQSAPQLDLGGDK